MLDPLVPTFAREAGLRAESIAIEATPPVWKTIVETADLHNAAAIVMGSRVLTGLRSMLLGSVSNAVTHGGLEVQPAIEAKPPTIAP